MKKLELTEVKSHRWEYMSWNSDLGLLTTELVFIPLHPKSSHCISNERNVLCVVSHVQLFGTLCTVAHQAPLSMGFFRLRILERVAISSSRGSS